MSDDLTLAISALKGESVSAESSSSTSAAIDTPLLGAKRLIELIHNHAENKAESIRRGVFPALTAALAGASADTSLVATVSRAVKGLVFKNAPGRTAANEAAIPAALVNALRGVTASLVAGASAGADAPEAAASSEALSLGAVQETIDALTAVCMAHGEYYQHACALPLYRLSTHTAPVLSPPSVWMQRATQRMRVLLVSKPS